MHTGSNIGGFPSYFDGSQRSNSINGALEYYNVSFMAVDGLEPLSCDYDMFDDCKADCPNNFSIVECERWACSAKNGIDGTSCVDNGLLSFSCTW